MPRKTPIKVTVNDTIQENYTYILVEPIGRNFNAGFKPDLTPKEMLDLGVFGGQYLSDCQNEFPKRWFLHATLSPNKINPDLNFFEVTASQPLSVWRKKRGINEEHDPRGWFQWYCRFYMGRRLPKEDKRQIKRWKAKKRVVAQIKKECSKGDVSCQKRQRQTLLQWAYDSRNI
jgi:hypothetical protein